MRSRREIRFAYLRRKLRGACIAPTNHLMRVVSLTFVVACLAGCPGPHGDDDDIADAPPSDTPSTGAATLRIAWETDKTVPGDIGSNNQLEDVKFRMEALEANVAVSPNDPRTTLDEVKLHWDGDSVPDEIVFPDAPAGLYTSVVLKLDSEFLTHAIEIHGHYDTSGTNTGFEVESDDSLSISMNTDFDLHAGADMTVTIQIKVADAINQLDFTTDDDVTDGDPSMPAFRQRLQQAFTVKASPAAPDE
jgi:hypothetical protein